MTPHRLRQVVRSLDRGGVVAYPTEAVWGLGCDPLDAVAVQRLLALKRRPVGKGVILIAADFRQLGPWLAEVADELAAPALASWPGPNTWVWPARPGVPDWITGGRASIAVRVTAHPPAAALCRAWGGPLVSTSANPAGQPPARSLLALRRYFGSRLDGVLPAPLGDLGRPTRIRVLGSGITLRP